MAYYATRIGGVDAVDLSALLARPAWQAHAACRGVDVEVFCGPPTRRRENAAREMCARCTVTTECLALALATDSAGFWAGTTYADRVRLGRVVSGVVVTPSRWRWTDPDAA